jgi:glucoamylase
MHAADAGLWEFRTSTQIHTYTLLFHWAGAKSAYKIAEVFKDTELMEKAAALAAEAEGKLEMCYSPEHKAYMQAVGSVNMDASTLMMVTMNYLDHDSEKTREHIAAMEKELLTPQGLFYRYKHFDDFGVPETTFLVCAFWYVDALACVGRVEDARKILDNLLQFSNHLGIFSEDVGEDGSQWGNFPQTYSHVGLINAACRIARKLDTAEFL